MRACWIGVASAALLGASSCASAEGPWMQPGSNCMDCHGPSAHFSWTAAGTVYPARDAPADQGRAHVHIEITDAQGKTLSLESNEVGNFYTAEPLELPLRVAARVGDQTVEMPTAAPTGACASCHYGSPSSPGFGRIVGP